MRISGWLLLLEQTAAALCLLSCVGRSLGASSRVTGRVLLCALGAGAAVTGALTTGSPAVRATLLPVLCALPALAYPRLFPAGLRALPGATLLALVAAAGWTHLAQGLALPPVLALAAACAAVLLLPRLTLAAPPPRHATLQVRIGGHRLRADALVDTGNLLRDPVTGLPVILVSPALLRRAMPLPARDALSPGMRLLPVRTFSGTQTVILFSADALALSGRPVRALLALSPDPDPRFEALVPACLFDSAKNRRNPTWV